MNDEYPFINWPFIIHPSSFIAPRGPSLTLGGLTKDDMSAAIAQVDAELEAALNSLDGWAEDVLARERDRIRELRDAWNAQANRVREMDRLLSLPQYAPSAREPESDQNKKMNDERG